jgi:hypothetical protein
VLDEAAAVRRHAAQVPQPQLQLGERARLLRDRDRDDGRHDGEMRAQQRATVAGDEATGDEEQDHREVRERNHHRGRLPDRVGHASSVVDPAASRLRRR